VHRGRRAITIEPFVGLTKANYFYFVINIFFWQDFLFVERWSAVTMDGRLSPKSGENQLRAHNHSLEGEMDADIKIKAVAVVPIRGYSNTWKVAEPSDTGDTTQNRVVNLEIQGDGKDGFHLIMSPDGCFTADTWHETLEDAKDTAYRIFGVPADGWG
jgi:hypothetical protein